MSDNDIFGEFSSITGVTNEDEVVNYLSAADFQLQSAIDLYFASNNNQTTIKQSISPSLGLLDEEEYVRKPDEVKRSRLLDESEWEQLEYAGMGFKFTYPSIMTEEKSRNMKHISAFGSAGPSSKGNKKPRLATLYGAPTDISCPLQYDDMIDQAKAENKWVVVNLQSESEFLSHQLNRDVWGDETMKDMLRCSFFFWQKLDISLDGGQFVSRYKVLKFPHVAIINPITGAAVWKIEGQFEPSRLMEKLQDFLGNYSTPSQFVMVRKIQAPLSTETSSEGSSKPICDPEIIKQSSVMENNGFNKLEISKSSFPDCAGDNDNLIALKIRFPSKSLVLKLPDTSTVIYLLAKICGEATDMSQYFDVIHGFPQVKLSEQISVGEWEVKTLKDVNIVANSVLTIRFLNI